MRIKTWVNRALHVFGLHMSRYYPPTPGSERKVRPYAGDVFGNEIYLNVHDILDYGSLSHVPMNRFGRWDGEHGFIINEVKPGGTVLDIGANIGFFTLLLAKIVGPTGRVFAFEPGPVSFAFLKANVLVNGYKNVTLVNKAVAATTGAQKLYVALPRRPGESADVVSNIPLDFGSEIREALDIETVSLDEYFAGVEDKIAFIRMDINGGEYFALRGMQRILKRNESVRLAIAYCPYLPSYRNIDIREFLGLIRSFGFSIYDLTKRNPHPVDDQYLLTTYSEPGAGTTLLLQRS